MGGSDNIVSWASDRNATGGPKPSKQDKGRRSKMLSLAQIMALYTAQSAMAFGRVGRWGRLWMLSDWALYMLANMMGYLYGSLAGGFVAVCIIDERVLDDIHVIKGILF